MLLGALFTATGLAQGDGFALFNSGSATLGLKVTPQETKPSDVRELKLGEPIERELLADQSHTYRVSLSPGQYIQISVEQFSLNVWVELADPSGREIVSRDWWWRDGTETFWVSTDVGGEHILKVSASAKPDEKGKYRIRLEKVGELGQAADVDRNYVSAHKFFTDGQKLRAQGTEPSNREAMKLFEQALVIWRSLKDGDAEGQTLNEMAIIQFRSGKLMQATEYSNQSVTLFRGSGNRRMEMNSLVTLSNILNYSGETQKALENYERALPIARGVRDYKNEAGILAGLGSMLHKLGQTHKALETLNELLRSARANGYVDGEAVGHNNIGLIHVSQGRLRDAVEHYSQTLALLEKSGDRFGQSTTLNNIGNAHARMGEFQQALDCLLRSLSLKRVIGDRRGEAASLGSIGYLYLRMGDEQKSLQYYNHSLALSRTVGSRDVEIAALSNLGIIYVRTGNLEKALEHSTQALAMRRQSGDRNGEAYDLSELGRVYTKLGDLPKALDHHEKALIIRRSVGDRYGEAQTLYALGAIYEQMGDEQKALESFNQTLSLTRSTGDKLGEASALFQLARMERERGGALEARAKLKEAIDIVESTREKVSLADVRSTYFASVQSYYELYIDLLMQLYRSESNPTYLAEALLSNERRSARTLLDSLAEARADIRAGVALELLERERRLQQDLNGKADQQVRLLSRKHTTEQAATLAREIAILTTEHEQVQSLVRQSSPRYAALTQPQPLPANEIQKLLERDTVLLEYALGDERSFVWAITPTSIKGFELPDRVTIEAAAERFNKTITENQNRNIPQQIETGAALSRLVLAPVANELGRKKIVVVRDGALLRVPFSALPIPANDSVRRSGRALANRAYQPLIFEHEIVQLPSSSVLAVVRRETATRAPAEKLVAVIADPVFQPGDPRVKTSVAAANSQTTSESKERSEWESGLEDLQRLPFSRREADAIVSMVGNNQSFKAVDFAANRAAVSNDVLSRYRVVHFATHAMLNNSHPELSGIVLSLVDENGKPQNGFVRMYEIYNLRLSADLVVLSACRTAVGKQVKGEGLIGLTRGFMYAGSSRVMVSLWEVNDEATAELMKRFYTAMFIKGMRPAAALRTAQLAMWRSGWWQAPYYWAAFEIQGEFR